MRRTPHFHMTEPDEVKRLIRNHPWATFVSATSPGLVASPYSVLLEERCDDIAVYSHFGQPDDAQHELGQHPVLVIVQGPHDYASPSWYASGELVGTWNHVTAHLYGTPQILSAQENPEALCPATSTPRQYALGPKPTGSPCPLAAASGRRPGAVPSVRH